MTRARGPGLACSAQQSTFRGRLRAVGSETGGAGRAGGFSLASGGDDLDAPGGKKRKNVISRSGNRMGQRQRRALAEQAAEGGGGAQGGRGGGRGSGKGRGRAGGSSGGRGGSKGASGRGGGGKGGGKAGGQQSGARPAVAAAQGGSSSAGALHPSWEAKKNASAGIQAFQGKRITFD